MNYAVKAERLIDGTGAEPLMHAAVLVEDNRITAVGKQSEVPIPEGFTVLDAAGKTVMPGMIDAHVHIQGSGDPNDPYVTPGYIALTSVPKMTLQGLKNAQKCLYAGFTTIRNCGSDFFVDVEVRDAICSGDVQGPRIWAAGKGVTSTRGHMDKYKQYAPHVRFEGMTEALMDSPYEGRAAVMKNIARNVDFIKMNLTLAEYTKRYTGEKVKGCPEVPKEIIKAVIETAHWEGRTVTAHCFGGEEAVWAIEAGIDGLEHGFFLDTRHIELMARHNVTFCPTLSVRGQLDRYDGDTKDPVALRWRAMAKRVWDAVAEAKKAGVRIIAGTDAAMHYCWHGTNATELEYLVKAGLTPMEAIVAATGDAALGIGMPDVGFIKPGYCADLIVFDGNPLEDIKGLQDMDKILVVMADGKIVADRSRQNKS